LPFKTAEVIIWPDKKTPLARAGLIEMSLWNIFLACPPENPALQGGKVHCGDWFCR
jgi:hypothetical protein